MSEEKKRVLDLDEMFGQDRPVKVKWSGQEYELLRLEAFSPREVQRFAKLQAKVVNLQSSSEIDDMEDEIEPLFNEMLSALCKDLPLDDIPFLAKTRIIIFYIEETGGKKALEAALMTQPIGATS